MRRDALTGLAELGIEIDEQRNSSPPRRPADFGRQLADHRSGVPTNEELAIARDCVARDRLIRGSGRRRRSSCPPTPRWHGIKAGEQIGREAREVD